MSEIDPARLDDAVRLVGALRDGLIKVNAFEAAAALRDILIAVRSARNSNEILRRSTRLTRFAIENRGCTCNKPGHRCGTNLLLEDVAKIEEHLA